MESNIEGKAVRASRQQLPNEQVLSALIESLRAVLPPSQPVGVLLSGGLDSAVVMELAQRLHPNVTAVVVGKPGSPDVRAAVRLCQQYHYRYEIITPEEDDLLGAALPTIKRLGIRLVLTGDGADELFAGYNEFIWLSPDELAARRPVLMARVSNQFQQQQARAKSRGINLVSPYLSETVQQVALSLPVKTLIRRVHHHVVTKAILRDLAREFLPPYITERYQLSWPYGAGFAGNANASERPVADNKLLVAEFERLPVYYPLYHATHRGLYRKRDVQVEFISTGGDDVTYTALLNGSADIGVADPIFSQAEYFTRQGIIIGELIGRLPLVAVTFRPEVHVSTLTDFDRYVIGTFPQFTTTHTVTTYLLPNAEIRALDFTELLARVQQRDVDIAIVIPEQAAHLVALGGRVAYNFKDEFPHFLFSGIFQAEVQAEKPAPRVAKFLRAVKEALQDIQDNPEQALEQFRAEFPDQLGAEQLFSDLRDLWTKNLKVHAHGLSNSRKAWHRVYPWLVKESLPLFSPQGVEDDLMGYLTSKQFSRSSPYREQQLRDVLQEAIARRQPVVMVSYWEVNQAGAWNEEDEQRLRQLQQLLAGAQKLHSPGIDLMLILNDEHARQRGTAEKTYRKYLEDVERRLRQEGIRPVWLSTLWRRWHLRDDIVAMWHERFIQRDHEWWKKVPLHVEREAAARLLVGSERAVIEAQRQYVTNFLEAKRLYQHWPKAILLDFNTMQRSTVLAEMPILHLR